MPCRNGSKYLLRQPKTLPNWLIASDNMPQTDFSVNLQYLVMKFLLLLLGSDKHQRSGLKLCWQQFKHACASQYRRLVRPRDHCLKHSRGPGPRNFACWAKQVHLASTRSDPAALSQGQTAKGKAVHSHGKICSVCTINDQNEKTGPTSCAWHITTLWAWMRSSTRRLN